MAVAADEEEFQEVDPTGRFGRYSAVLGSAPSRRCTAVRLRPARAEENIEVAQNLVRLRTLDPAMVDRLHAEVRLLRSLHHDHIIVFHKVWLDRDAGLLNFFAEVCNSGSLCEDHDRHKHVSVKTQEVCAPDPEGLEHLHTHDPALHIMHHDLNCSNVFINNCGDSVRGNGERPPPKLSMFRCGKCAHKKRSIKRCS